MIRIYTLVLVALLTSCNKKNNQQEKVKDNVEASLKPQLNDPDSYEFVELVLVDSTLYSDNIKSIKQSFQSDLQTDQDDLKRQIDYRSELPEMYDKNHVAELNKKIANNKQILLEIDKLQQALGAKVNDVASYRYAYRFRSKNGFGAKVLNQYIVQTGPAPEYSVINLADDVDKVLLTPNTFPGYTEMIKKHL